MKALTVQQASPWWLASTATSIDLRDLPPTITGSAVLPGSPGWFDYTVALERWRGRMFVKHLAQRHRRQLGLPEVA